MRARVFWLSTLISPAVSDIRQTARNGDGRKCKQAKRKKRKQCCHMNEASFDCLTRRGHKSIELACYDTACRPGEPSLSHILFHFTYSPPFFPYSHLLHPFCPCHNFISLHVISKLAPNEFLISPNSVAVVITFIVFSFTISHIGGRGACVWKRWGGKQKQWDRQLFRQRDRSRDTEKSHQPGHFWFCINPL